MASTPGQRAEAELRRDPFRPDREIAAATAVSRNTVLRARDRLETAGVIPPRPHPQSALSRVMAELRRDPARSDRAIAQAAGAHQADAWRIRRRLQAIGTIPRTSDRVARPRRPGRALSAAAALPQATPRQLADAFDLPYSSAKWALAEHARRHGTTPAPRARPPVQIPVTELPPAPDFSQGICAQVKPSMRSWWTSADKDEREAAARMCAGCAIQDDCATWSISLPWSDRDAVWAGMLPGERLRRKRELRDQITRQALAAIRQP
jgi:DNA-binding Lrp family transcriptional regulator